ncbi:MAG: hypothetical protein GY796_18300, partial [Chloroflexi bacterium]|nr:hypothetical protein [Chloroflexota bacterium]
LMCIDLVGQQGCCKTTILNMLSLGFMKLQDEGADIEMYLIDPRSGVPKAAASFLKPVLHRFKQTVLGELAIEQGQHIELLQKIEQELNQRREQGYKTPYLVILIDEIYDSVDINDYAKECYRLLKKIRRLREAGVFQVLVHRDRAREGAGNLGTGLMNHSVSAFVVNCTKSKAVKVLENGAADKAVDLEKGQA